MKIRFIKDCGHRPAGLILECENDPGAQYIAGGFAEVYVEPKPEPTPKAENVKGMLSEKILNALMDAGYESVDAVCEASDEELLAVKGIGKAALKLIREL